MKINLREADLNPPPFFLYLLQLSISSFILLDKKSFQKKMRINLFAVNMISPQNIDFVLNICVIETYNKDRYDKTLTVGDK